MISSTRSQRTISRRSLCVAVAGGGLWLTSAAAVAAVAAGHQAETPATTPPTVTSATSVRTPSGSADAIEHWIKAQAGANPSTCRPDAARRWQGPDIAPADLPFTADAAEAWLAPEIAVKDLPYSADAAEHWLCAP